MPCIWNSSPGRDSIPKIDPQNAAHNYEADDFPELVSSMHLGILKNSSSLSIFYLYFLHLFIGVPNVFPTCLHEDVIFMIFRVLPSAPLALEALNRGWLHLPET